MSNEMPSKDKGQPENRYGGFPHKPGKGGESAGQAPVDVTFNQIAFALKYGVTTEHPHNDYIPSAAGDSEPDKDSQG